MIRKLRDQNECPTLNTEMGKYLLITDIQILIQSERIVSRVSSYFPIGDHQVTRLS